jgi:hypothetical protein
VPCNCNRYALTSKLSGAPALARPLQRFVGRRKLCLTVAFPESHSQWRAYIQAVHQERMQLGC